MYFEGVDKSGAASTLLFMYAAVGDYMKSPANCGNGEGSGQSKSIDDIIEGAKDTTNDAGVARNYEKTGGFEKALEDFESLGPSNVKDIQTQYGPGKVGTLSDGTKVVVRPGSKTGGSTLEIKVSSKKIYKIRY